MRYRGTLNVDFTNSDGNQYNRLKAALVAADWLHVETSAYVIENPNLALIWRGIEIVAKQAAATGQLSALTFHVQGSDDFGISIPPLGNLNGPAIRDQILGQPFPEP
jgi:hypothetical protein